MDRIDFGFGCSYNYTSSKSRRWYLPDELLHLMGSLEGLLLLLCQLNEVFPVLIEGLGCGHMTIT